MNTKDIRTGDILLFSSNTGTAFLVRLWTSTEWNHVAVAVRINSNKEITIDETGELYILEINTFSRVDAITGKMQIGAAYSEFQWVVERYNRVAVRPMRNKYRTQVFADRIPQFYKKYSNSKFTEVTADYIRAGLDVHSGTEKKHVNTDSMFCSEYVARFYLECVLPSINHVENATYDTYLDILFGDKCPYLPELYIPAHYSLEFSNNCLVLESKIFNVYIRYENWFIVILVPFLIAIAAIIVILIFIQVVHSYHNKYFYKSVPIYPQNLL